MAYVVCEPCHDCKYTDCVVVCPCECFYQDEWMLYIDPEHCIDCDACRTECPVDAIFPEVEVPNTWQRYIPLNLERTKLLKENGPLLNRQEPKDGPGCASRREPNKN